MDTTALAQQLNDQYGLSQLKEIGTTEISTLLRATNTWGTTVREVEVFRKEVPEPDRDSVPQLEAALQSSAHPGSVTVTGCGLTPDSQLFVLRDQVTGRSLESLIEGRAAWGNHFTTEEATKLLQQIASAIDQFNKANHSSFLLRSINTERILIQDGSNPAILTLVGPSIGAGTASPDDNRRAFADVIAKMTGTAIDEDIFADAASCTEYLEALTRPASREPESTAPSKDSNAAGFSVVGPSEADTIDYAQHHENSNPEEDTVVTDVASTKEHADNGENVHHADSRNTSNDSDDSPARVDDARPVQHYPSTDPSMRAVEQDGTYAYSQQDYQGPPPGYQGYEEPEKKRKVWPWVLALVLILALIAGGVAVWYFFFNKEPWSDTDQQTVDAFPGIVSENQGGSGWQDLTCTSMEAEAGQDSKIRCADEALGVTITRFPSEEAREDALPNGDAVTLGADQCEVTSYEIEGQEPPAFIMAPEGDNSSYLITINGADAEQKRLSMPIC